MKRTLLAAFVLGAVTVAGFSPFDIFPLPFIALALLFMLWRGAARPRYAALIGFVWGLGFFLTGVSWVYVSLHDVGDMAPPLAAAATFLFSAYLALFPALAAYVYKRHADDSAWRGALLAAGAWTLSEWLRGWLLTGFPWLSVGYSQVGASPLFGFAPLLGSYGVGFILALLAASFAFGWWRWQTWGTFAVLFIVGAALKTVQWTEPSGVPVTVSLLQGNISQSLKWDPQRLDLSLSTYRRLASEHRAAIVVLPETAVPLLFDQIPSGYLQQLAADGNVLLGAAIRSGVERYSNSAIALNGSHTLGTYAKTHLVPFGEFVPPGFHWFFDLVRIPMTDFESAQTQQKPFDIASLSVAVNICYEDLFGEEIIRQLPEATVLVNLSNTAWFGHSLAQPQHLQIARMRAMEAGRPMLRATNTGMTAAIDPDGSVSAVLPAFEEGGLTVDVQGYKGATPYSRIGNYGVVVVFLLALYPALRQQFRAREKGWPG